MVELIDEELAQSQLQEIIATEDGLVMGFYRFQREPRMNYLIFDLDRSCPMLVLLDENPWLRFKKTKPVGLFLNSHAKNQFFTSIEIKQELGRVILMKIGREDQNTEIEFRAIPKQPNLIIKSGKKSISWHPVVLLAENNNQYTQSSEAEEIRSIAFMIKDWKKAKFMFAEKKETSATQNPYERWIKNRKRDLEKKNKALHAVETQIDQFRNEEWGAVGEHLKTYGLKNLKPEWSVYVDFDEKVSRNIQKCFEKAKAAQTKIVGAAQRLQILKREVADLADLSEEKFKTSLILLENKRKKSPPRPVEGRLRKIELSSGESVAYMGKSAADNMKLLKQSKPHDLWLHLKDYPSAHAIVHLQKNQSLSDSDLRKVGKWLLSEGLSKSQAEMGGKYGVVVVECRHVKPLKGDKMGRVTYHNAREILIAL